MRLLETKIRNFRCYKEEVSIRVDNLTVLVGKNDSGKSAVLEALEIFFAEKTLPDNDDLCVSCDDAESEVRISCTFDRLPEELIVDAQHPTNLAKEYLLNQRGLLELVRVYACAPGSKPKLKGTYSRAFHPTATNFNDLLSLTNAKLKARAKELGCDLSKVDQTINTELRHIIWQQNPAALNLTEIEVELKPEIWDQIKKHLPIFALFKSDRPSTDQDAEAQDPMKAAIKEAIQTQEEALRSIEDKVKRELQTIVDRTVEKIREMSPELASQLSPRVSNKNWDTLFSVSLTGDGDIPINKRGSGTRRLILLNFFRAKAEQDAETKGANIIYAIEEPETSQHPHNQKMLVEAFEDLAERSGCQVLLTTHTPVLARRFSSESLRYILKQDNRIQVMDGKDEATVKAIVDSLGVLADHDIKVFFGVEGRHDIEFFKAISKILKNAGESVPDLGHAEGIGHLLFVPLGGSSLDLWLSRLKGFNRKEFYVMDRDTKPPAAPKYSEAEAKLRERPNCVVWTTEKKELENYIHPDVIKGAISNYSGTGEDFEDVPVLVAKAVHEASGSGDDWTTVVGDKEKLAKKVSKAKKRLNAELVKAMTPELLTKIDPKNLLRAHLKAVGEALG